MPDSLKARADALRAEAKAARADVTAEYQARMTKIDTESARVRRETRNAEQSAKQATEDAEGHAAGARVQYTSANELEASAAKAAQRGDVKQAEEDNELAAHARGSAQRYEQQEREATLEAAQYREDAAGHDLRAKELQYEVRDTNRLNNAAEQQLDNLEERARLYDEAIRKFDEADGQVNAPTRARLQREADAAIARADAIEVDRAAIRVLAPDFPEQPPGFETPVSTGESTSDEQVAAATDDAGDDGTADRDPDESDGADDLGLDLGDEFAAAAPSEAGSPADVEINEPSSADFDVASFEPEVVDQPVAFGGQLPEFDVAADSAAFAESDSFASSDFAMDDASADASATETDDSFATDGFA